MRSAIGMKSAGPTSPSTGERHRSSASIPVIPESSIATTGWYTTYSSPRSSARRRWRSSVRRLTAASRMLAANTFTVPRRSVFAAYSARSAARIASSPLAASPTRHTPRVTVTSTSSPSRLSGSAQPSASRWPSASAAPSSRTPSATSTNSSPPGRASRSPWRTWRDRRSATDHPLLARAVAMRHEQPQRRHERLQRPRSPQRPRDRRAPLGRSLDGDVIHGAPR